MIPEKRKKILSLLIAGALFIVFIGQYFLIYNLEYGFEVYLTGLIAIGILYPFRYFNKEVKTIKEMVKVILVLSWLLIMVLGMFDFAHLYLLVVLSLFSGLVWLILEIIDFRKQSKASGELNYFKWIGVGCIALSVILKILVLPLNSIPQIFGTIIASFGFFLEYSPSLRNRVYKIISDMVRLKID